MKHVQKIQRPEDKKSDDKARDKDREAKLAKALDPKCIPLSGT